MGPRAGYDRHKRKRDSKVHMAVDTLGLLLAVRITPANEQERAQVAEFARQVQHVTGQTVKLASADQGYTGEMLRSALIRHVNTAFVLLPANCCINRIVLFRN
jgi:transposase